jgi:hypothetical protein
LVSAVIHPVGRGKREKERESCRKKKEFQRERQTERRVSVSLRGTATYYVGTTGERVRHTDRRRETIDVEYRLQ